MAARRRFRKQLFTVRDLGQDRESGSQKAGRQAGRLGSSANNLHVDVVDPGTIVGHLMTVGPATGSEPHDRDYTYQMTRFLISTIAIH